TVTTLVAAVERDPALEIAIDVERRTVTAPAAGVSATFPLDDHARQRLLEGLDDIALTLRHERDIAAYEARRSQWLPRVRRSPRRTCSWRAGRTATFATRCTSAS